MAVIEYDAVVVGSGPNGLAAGIVLQQAGLSVLLVEGRPTIGGGMRTAELTLPGFRHDVCSAIHPMGISSPFFRQLPLADHGLEWVHPPIALAHPFDDGSAAVLAGSVEKTAARLGADRRAYQEVFGHLADQWGKLETVLLAPLTIPRHPFVLARFGLRAIRSCEALADRFFSTREARGLFAGLAAHSLLPLSRAATAAIGLVLGAVAHRHGWPMARGGSQSIADALAGHLRSIGGKIETGRPVRTLAELPAARAVLLDVTPRQLTEICGDRLSRFYRWQIGRYRFGAGAFKVDWALREPAPFTAPECREAGTVHLGGSLEEIAIAEQTMEKGLHSASPFVLFAQQTRFDSSRAPAGSHAAWAYCHVPHGSVEDRTAAVERQVERFAPGFRDTILARHTMTTADFQTYNPNYIGGDINGGAQTIDQVLFRPAFRICPYRTSIPNVYLCSSSTPPGGGVHGMCGYHAARAALRQVFRLSPPGGVSSAAT
jgi:phytoene dehydrogenase-like protein